MSQNLYVGADLNPPTVAVVSGNPAAIVGAVTQFWRNLQGTNFPERATALARQVEVNQPDLIGLQEVSLIRSGPFDSFSTHPTPAAHVEYDYLQILLDNLENRGLHYAPVVATTDSDAEFPGLLAAGQLRDLRLTDRDVILARTDLPTSEMQLSNAEAQHFVHNVVLPIGNTGQTFTLFRSWAAVDVQLRGKDYRFVTSHLESLSPAVQVAQGQELAAGPANTSLPVVLAGDFNSRADGAGTATYQNLLAAGFSDAWTLTHPGEDGFTCGNQADLRNAVPLSEDPRRIDLVLFKGDWQAIAMDRTGVDQADRTVSGLWPSDHAGVVATLGLHVRPGTDVRAVPPAPADSVPAFAAAPDARASAGESPWYRRFVSAPVQPQEPASAIVSVLAGRRSSPAVEGAVTLALAQEHPLTADLIDGLFSWWEGTGRL